MQQHIFAFSDVSVEYTAVRQS